MRSDPAERATISDDQELTVFVVETDTHTVRTQCDQW